MCCFTAKTEVHSTEIFARMVTPSRQALVYQMQYSATEPTAMILPLPVKLAASEASIEWKNLKDDSDFFTQLARGFPAVEHFSLSRSKSAGVETAAVIPVHEVGDFVASFVPSVNEFERLDPRFVIKKEIWAKFPEYADYGFAVFQLKALTGAPHPIAFQFDTRLPSTLYFPTVHIHDGTVHAEDQFDHALYLQDAAFDRLAGDYQGPADVDRGTGFVRSKDLTATFADVSRSTGILDGSLLVHRKTMAGLLPNKDTLVDLSSRSSAHASGCGRCDVGVVAADSRASLGPTSIALAGLAWIIRRRNERQGS